MHKLTLARAGRARTGGWTIDRFAPRASPQALVLAAGLLALLALAHRPGDPRTVGHERPLAGQPVEPRPKLARILPVLLPPVRRAPRPAAGPGEPEPASSARAAPPPSAAPPLPAALQAGPPDAGEGLDLLHLPLAAPLDAIVVASPFGPRPSPFTGRPSRHEGVDLVAPPGSPVYAVAAGRVRRVGPDGAFGLSVEIDHGRGLVTRYAHLRRILVRAGAAVAAGEPIGQVGSSGRSTGPHLHYEVRVAGEPIDPLRLIEAGRLLALARGGGRTADLDAAPVQVYDPNGLGGEAEPGT